MSETDRAIEILGAYTPCYYLSLTPDFSPGLMKSTLLYGALALTVLTGSSCCKNIIKKLNIIKQPPYV